MEKLFHIGSQTPFFVFLHCKYQPSWFISMLWKLRYADCVSFICQGFYLSDFCLHPNTVKVSGLLFVMLEALKSSIRNIISIIFLYFHEKCHHYCDNPQTILQFLLTVTFVSQKYGCKLICRKDLTVYRLAKHLIMNWYYVVPPLALKTVLNSSWHGFHNMLETFFWGSGPCWHDCIASFLQTCQLHVHAPNLLLYHIPTVRLHSNLMTGGGHLTHWFL